MFLIVYTPGRQSSPTLFPNSRVRALKFSGFLYKIRKIFFLDFCNIEILDQFRTFKHFYSIFEAYECHIMPCVALKLIQIIKIDPKQNFRWLLRRKLVFFVPVMSEKLIFFLIQVISFRLVTLSKFNYGVNLHWKFGSIITLSICKWKCIKDRKNYLYNVNMNQGCNRGEWPA